MAGIRKWTAVPIVSGGTGTVEYRIDATGVVVVRANLVKTGAYAEAIGVILPVEAAPIFPNTLYFDWTGAPADFNTTVLGVTVYFLIYSLPGFAKSGVLAWQGTPLPDGEHSLENVLAGVKSALENIVGLHVYDFPSSTVQPPAAVLSLPETPYDVTLGGRSDEWTFPLWLLVSKADDKSAYAEMMPYLEAEGDRSIRAMIEADRTLGGACDTCAVLRARPQFATVQGVEFLAVEFTLEVYT